MPAAQWRSLGEQLGERDHRHLGQVDLDELANETADVRLGQDDDARRFGAAACAKRSAHARPPTSAPAAGASVRKLPAGVRVIARRIVSSMFRVEEEDRELGAPAVSR